jgi:D-alanine-D-alanine ligase
MTSHSLVPKSAASVGINYERLCLHLLAGATLDSIVQQQKKAEA